MVDVKEEYGDAGEHGDYGVESQENPDPNKPVVKADEKRSQYQATGEPPAVKEEEGKTQKTEEIK